MPDLLAPIRPTEKFRYPLASLESYGGQHRADGLPVDPWQRVHARLGVVPVSIEDAWLSVAATADEWSAWTGITMTSSGRYVVPDALVPVHMDAESGVGHYVEPHLWMRYRIA
jgi:hypothetical protein